MISRNRNNLVIFTGICRIMLAAAARFVEGVDPRFAVPAVPPCVCKGLRTSVPSRLTSQKSTLRVQRAF